jgi:8-oxo-dGTP pyrophosphatase MutT (NUDIX family)
MPTPWTILHRRTLHQDRWIHLEAHAVRSGTGAILDPYYQVTAPNWVTIVPLLPDGRVVCVEQWRHAAKRICLELPAGNIDEGEDARTAAERELQEETGYLAAAGPRQPNAWTCLGTAWPEPARSTATCTGFLVEVAPEPGPTQREADEDLAIVLAPLTWLLNGADGRFVHAAQLGHLHRAERLIGKG